MGDWHEESVGRDAEVHVWIERTGRAKRVRRMGSRSARASILASSIGVRSFVRGRQSGSQVCAALTLMV
jgi:hypothetical protein